MVKKCVIITVRKREWRRKEYPEEAEAEAEEAE